ncbi:hypothetical protein GBAR_LOCUS4585 [Geodia barretti]
MGNRP